MVCFNWSWTVCILQHVSEWYFWLEAHYNLLLNVVDQYHFCGWLTVRYVQPFLAAIERNKSVSTRYYVDFYRRKAVKKQSSRCGHEKKSSCSQHVPQLQHFLFLQITKTRV